jgi:hypothetical protein
MFSKIPDHTFDLQGPSYIRPVLTPVFFTAAPFASHAYFICMIACCRHPGFFKMLGHELQNGLPLAWYVRQIKLHTGASERL